MVAGGPSFRVLAIGASCPSGLPSSLQKGFKECVHIVRTLHATHSCFISQCSVKVPSLGGTAQAVVKSYMKSRLDDTELQQVELEIRLHHKLTDRYAVPFWIAVEDSSQIHIICKFCAEGDLRQRITAGRMSEATVRDQVALPLLHVLLDMHSKGFVHRDLKPENVFVSDDHVLLGDFGLAVALLQQTAATDADADAPASDKHGHDLDNSSHLQQRNSRTSNGGSILQDCGIRSSSTSGCYPKNISTSGANHDAAGASAALKRVSVSSSDVMGLADCSNSSSITSPRRISGIGMRRSSSAGSVGVWGKAAMPQLPNEVAGGTPAYSAPEIIRAAFNSTPAAAAVGPQNDIWALGVLALECVTGQHPFGDSNMSPYAFMFNIIGNKQLPLQQLPVTDQCKDWLSQALERDPTKRASAQQLLQHEWAAMRLEQQQHTSMQAADDNGQKAEHVTEIPDGVQKQQSGQQEQQRVCHKQASCPVQPADCLDGSLSADLLKMSGLTGAEAAVTGWQGVGGHAWSHHQQPQFDVAAVWGSGCGSTAVAGAAAGYRARRDWQLQTRNVSHVLESPCRLQHHNSCPPTGTTVGVYAQQQQQKAPVSFGFLSSIGSWED